MKKLKSKRRERRLIPLAPAKPKRKVRRNPYARALDQATAKYNKAVLDYQKLLLKKEELELALPRLERMKLALEEYLRGGGTGPRPELRSSTGLPADIPADAKEAVAILSQPLPPRVATGPAPGGFVIPAHLQHMIKEHPLLAKDGKVRGGVTHVQLPSAEPDDMLPDLGPGDDLIPDHPVIIDPVIIE